MKSLLNYLIVFVFSLLTGPWSGAQVSVNNDTDPLLANALTFPAEWSPGQGGRIEIKMTLPDGFHAYEDQFRLTILEPDGFKVAPLNISPIKTWFDKFSKKDRTGFEKEALLTAHIEAPNRFLKRHTRMKVELIYQACSAQFCLFPTKKIIEFPIAVTSVEGESKLIASSALPSSTSTTGSFFDSDNLNKYLGTSLLTGLLFIFLAGIFTSFTPCIFPMIPITLAVLGNHSNERTRWQNFVTSLVYVLGIATTYSLLGLAAASSGVLFGATLGNPYVLSVICLIFFVMALSMYGLFEIQVPALIRNKFGTGKPTKSLKGAYFTGLFAGIVASPCVGPVLVAILTYVASTQNKFLGFIYLFVYALGLGLIFIVLGLSNQLSRFLPRSGNWMNGFKFILGSLMLSAFYYYLDLLLPGRFFDLALGLGLIVVASAYGAFFPTQGKAFYSIRKGLMIAVLIVGIAHLVSSALDLRPLIRGTISGDSQKNEAHGLNWQPYSEELLAEATKNQKPVIIDFWAEWCAACHELAEHTFTDFRVRALSEKFVLLKFDATKDTAELRALKTKYKIQGLPTVLFVNQHGIWNDSLTLTNFEKADAFLKRMEKILD